MGVHLREKKMGNGEVSLYLDIYHNKVRWYEFLKIHINKKKPTQEDAEKRKLAKEIRTKREHELTVQNNGLIDKKRQRADFITWCSAFYKTKPYHRSYEVAINHLRDFVKHRPVPFDQFTPTMCREFTTYLLGKVSNNTALGYNKTIFGALEEAVRQDILTKNPSLLSLCLI